MSGATRHGVCCCNGVLGACCIAGECSQRTEAGCLAAGGTWQGEGVECETELCPNACCGTVINRCFRNSLAGGTVFLHAKILSHSITQEYRWHRYDSGGSIVETQIRSIVPSQCSQIGVGVLTVTTGNCFTSSAPSVVTGQWAYEQIGCSEPNVEVGLQADGTRLYATIGHAVPQVVGRITTGASATSGVLRIARYSSPANDPQTAYSYSCGSLQATFNEDSTSGGLRTYGTVTAVVETLPRLRNCSGEPGGGGGSALFISGEASRAGGAGGSGGCGSCLEGINDEGSLADVVARAQRGGQVPHHEAVLPAPGRGAGTGLLDLRGRSRGCDHARRVVSAADRRRGQAVPGPVAPRGVLSRLWVPGHG